MDAAAPLPAWRPNFKDSSTDGPFLKAIRAAYAAHAWVRSHAGEFPVTLLRSPPPPPSPPKQYAPALTPYDMGKVKNDWKAILDKWKGAKGATN